MIDFVIDNRADLQYVASLIVGLAMLRLGAGPERVSAATFLGLIIMPVVVFRFTGSGAMLFGSYSGLYVLCDVLAFAAFMWVALNANRTYPLWLAGFQLVAIGAHGVKALGDVVSPVAYVILAIGPSYGQLLVMVWGLVAHRRRRRTFGPYRDWRAGYRLPRLAAVFGGG